MRWQDRYRHRFYGRRAMWIDGTTEFHISVERLCRRGERILEIGAGPTNPTTTFLASIGEVHGVDPDVAVLANDALMSASVLRAGHYPFEDNTFGLCVSNYVVEHIPNAVAHLAEVARVLKPGGAYAFRTVNRAHYIGFVASVTPYWFHRLVANRSRGMSTETHDPYPTTYVLNTARAIRGAAAAAGLSVERLNFVEKEPVYGSFSRIVYLFMVAYERIVNSRPWLSQFRANMFVVLRKP
jgi:SAM-dependent methyltransferase